MEGEGVRRKLAFVSVLILGGGFLANVATAVANGDEASEPIPVVSEWTPTTQVFDNQDGTLTATIHSAPVQAIDPTSPTGWAPIDTTLVLAADYVAPEQTDASITFASGSSGETGPMATIEKDGASLSVAPDGDLGVPTLSGDTATYSDVLPGVDATLQARPSGFEVSYLVNAAADAPATLEIPLGLDGLSASLSEEGGLVLTDSAGTQVGGADPALMWGAGTDPETGDPLMQMAVATSLTSGPNGPILVLTPDQSFFTDPGITYPITIDPTVNLTMQFDTYTDSSNPTTGYGSSSQLRSGLFGSATYRTFIAFDPTAIAGTYVDSATLQLTETGSYSCDPSQLNLYSITAAGQVPVTWNNQPPEGTLYASVSAAHGSSVTSCPAATVSLADGGDDNQTLADLVQMWASDSSFPPGVEIRAANESDVNGAKTFGSSEASSGAPVLSVTYHSLPVEGNLVIDYGGLGVHAPAPGSYVTEIVLTTSGTQVLQVATASDGTVTTSYAGNDITTSGTDPYTTGCQQSGYQLLSYIWYNSYDWYYNDSHRPSRVSQADVITELKSATGNITGEDNDCSRSDTVSATYAYKGTTSEAPSISAENRCTGDDGFRDGVLGWGTLPSGVLASECAWALDLGGGADSAYRSDVKFNSSKPWYINRVESCPSGYFDLQDIATHEQGHTYGLLHVNGDPYNRETMYKYSSPCEIWKDSLGLGDMLGLEARY